jgi:hypothetical protein
MTKPKSPESPHFPDGVLTGAVADLQAHPQNYNRHGELQVADLMASLRRFGQRKPVVTWRETILAGHGLVEAARRLGWPAVWIAPAPETWTEAEALAYLAADNELARAGDPDRDALAILVAGLGDVDAELARLAAGGDEALRELLAETKPQAEDPGAQVDKAAELQAKWQTASGQMWQLGEHRLICGDCTDAATVARVMGGERANLLMTSPPYWVGKDYETQKNEEEIDRFVSAFIDAALTAMFDDYSRIVINTGVGRATSLDETDTRIILLLDKYVNALLAYRWKLRTLRHWVKGGGQPRPRRPIDDVCYFGIEYLMTFYKAGVQSRGQNIVSSAWAQQSDWTDIDGDRQENEAGFNLEIPSRFMELYTLPDEFVFEPFCGNGTTLIACERLSRKCRAVEISPAYVAVALQRWATMTGKTPVLMAG